MAVISSLPSNCLLRVSTGKAQYHYSSAQSLSAPPLFRKLSTGLAVSASGDGDGEDHHASLSRFGNCRNKMVALVGATAAGICMLSHMQTSAAADAPPPQLQFPTHLSATAEDVLRAEIQAPVVAAAATGGKDGACPAWRPIQLEMVVPGEAATPRSFSRQRRQWLALNLIAHPTPNPQQIPHINRPRASSRSKLTMPASQQPEGYGSAAAAGGTVQDLLAILSRQMEILNCFNL